MKSKVIYSAICAACLTLSTALTMVTAATNNTNNGNDRTLAVAESELAPSVQLEVKDETVYIITDASGKSTKSFIGSELNSSNEPLPITMDIKYYLDGKSFSSGDLGGKSGHIKMEYHFTSSKTYGDKIVPFIVITGLNLDTNKFANIAIDHGKIVRRAADTVTVAGYSLVGLGQDLGTDILNDGFSIEADVSDFAMGESYSIAMNDLIADVDASQFSSIESLTSSVNELAAGLDQLVAGSSDLANGLDSAFDGAKRLQSGIDELKSGVAVLSNGSRALSSGASDLATGAHQLSDGLGQVVAFDSQIVGKIDAATQSVSTRVAEFTTEYAEIIAELSTEYPELAAKLNQVTNQITDYYNQAYSAVTTYTGGIEALYQGSTQLAAGADTLAAGAAELDSGISALSSGVDALDNGSDQLAAGMAQLSNGSHTLADGLHTFKTSGIDRLVSFANNDLAGFMNNLRATVSAAKSYKHYSNKSAESVKFIFKTPSVE